MEPSPETFKEIGVLCVAWSSLEKCAEATIWGLLVADEKLGTVITGRLDLRARFELILQHAPKKHSPADVQELRYKQTLSCGHPRQKYNNTRSGPCKNSSKHAGNPKNRSTWGLDGPHNLAEPHAGQFSKVWTQERDFLFLLKQ